MALICDHRLPMGIVAAATLLGLGATFGWGQTTGGDTWRHKLAGNWCDADHGCAHWWTLYQIDVTDDDRIAIRYRDRRRLDEIFNGTIQEPFGPWTITLEIKGGPFDGRKFDAVVSELGSVKAIIEGKFKGSIKAKIQSADIEGIRVDAKDGIATISNAKVDAPKIDDLEAEKVTIDKVAMENAESRESKKDGQAIKGPEKLNAEKMSAAKLEASKLTADKIAGKAGREVEISIPLQISEATIEGNPSPKGRKRKDDDDEDNKRVVIDGRLKGKIATSKGQGELAGDFKADFKWLVKAVIKGTFVVLPYECSEAGSPLSEEQLHDLWQRPKAKVEVEEVKVGPRNKKEKIMVVRGELGRFRSRLEKDEKRQLRDVLKTAGFLDAAGKFQPIIAEAAKTRAPRPAEPHTRGKFMRRVSGAVSAIDPRTITLDLPSLPVLDHRCAVIDQLPKRTLKLVKQHDGVR
jgi:hypothetical protein